MNQNYRNELEKCKGEKRGVERSIQAARDLVASLSEDGDRIRQAQVIIQGVAKSTQDELCLHITGLVSMALAAVFPDPYQLKLDFVLKRNRSEAELTFQREGEDKVHPMSASGGGAVDVAAFALRVSLWSLQSPRSRNVIVMDEPFRFLSTDLQPRAGEMLKQVSDRLKVQIIIITHEEELLEYADKTFRVSIRKGISEVKS